MNTDYYSAFNEYYSPRVSEPTVPWQRRLLWHRQSVLVGIERVTPDTRAARSSHYANSDLNLSLNLTLSYVLYKYKTSNWDSLLKLQNK